MGKPIIFAASAKVEMIILMAVFPPIWEMYPYPFPAGLPEFYRSDSSIFSIVKLFSLQNKICHPIKKEPLYSTAALAANSQNQLIPPVGGNAFLLYKGF